METLNWGIIGTGRIANEFASQFDTDLAKIYGVASHTKEQAEAFANKYRVDHAFSNVAELLRDPQVDMVYIATPHNTHYGIIMESLEAGKHVVCEKSITISKKQLDKAVKLAKEKGLYLFEAMTIHYMPLYRHLKNWVVERSIGPLKMVQVNFGSYKDTDPSFYYFNKDLAGGALLDIGVYALNFVRWFLSSEPDEVLTMGNLHETGVDESGAIIMRNEEKEFATVSLTFRAKMPKQAVVAFEEGYFTITNYPRADKATFTTKDGKVEIIEAGSTEKALNYEATEISRIILEKEVQSCLPLTLDVLEIMDKVRESWGLHYPFEKE